MLHFIQEIPFISSEIPHLFKQYSVFIPTSFTPPVLRSFIAKSITNHGLLRRIAFESCPQQCQSAFGFPEGHGASLRVGGKFGDGLHVALTSRIMSKAEHGGI